MNLHAVRAIYLFEMSRAWRTIGQSILSPVISTCLYFIVFGSAIGSRISDIDGVSYGAFIVPGLIMLSLLTESISNASFGIYLPRFTGTIYEVLSAPISQLEIILGYVGAAASKSIVIGAIILATASLFVTIEIAHPLWMLLFLVLTAVTFSLFGFVIGIWADGFERLQIIPLLIVTPLTFLGGSFYSAHRDAVQSSRLPRQRIPMEFLWNRRRQRRAQHRHDRTGVVRLPRVRDLDLPHRLSTEAVEPFRQTVQLAGNPISFRPPMYGRSTSGTTTLPSACW
jgi:ABC-2 type transport system permease protein